MMKSKFKEAKQPEIPQLMWQTTPSGSKPLLLTTGLYCLQMSFQSWGSEAHHQHLESNIPFLPWKPGESVPPLGTP